jgi:hypothetical protein
MTTAQPQSIEARLTALEDRNVRTTRQNRLLKVCLLLVPAALLLGAASQRQHLQVGSITTERLVLRDSGGKLRALLEVDKDGRTLFELLGPDEKQAFRVSATTQPTPMTAMIVFTPGTDGRITSIAEKERTHIMISGENHKPRVSLGQRDANGPAAVEVWDEQGKSIAGKIGGK